MFNRGRESINKLVKFFKFSKIEQELEEAGHSRFASVVTAGASIAGGTTIFTAGAGLMTAGAAAVPEAPPVGSAAMTAGYLLMGKAEETSKVIKHYLPELIDKSIDCVSDVCTYASGFVEQCIKSFNSAEFTPNQCADIETAMIQFGYEDYVTSLYASLEEKQKYIYAIIARDVFMEHFNIEGGVLTLNKQHTD